MNKKQLIQKLESELVDIKDINYRLSWNQNKGEYIITIWV